MAPERAMAEDVAQARQALMAAAAAAFAAMLLLPPLLDFRVDYASFRPLLMLAAVPATFLPYVYWRGLHAMRAPLEVAAIGILLALPAIVFSFAAMRPAMPIADHILAAFERGIGFDWRAFLHLVDANPIIARLIGLGYNSFSIQLLFLPAILCFAGLPARAYRFVLCYLILVAISSLIGAFFPSEGAYVAFAVDPAALAHVDGKFGHFFLAAFHAVRTEPAFLLSFANVAGILTFPSVHAGVAALCAWAAWPSRPLRLPILTLNILMAIGTLPYGAHFLIDVLAGGAVAWLAVHLSGQLIRFFGRRSPTIDTEPLPAGAA